MAPAPSRPTGPGNRWLKFIDQYRWYIAGTLLVLIAITTALLMLPGDDNFADSPQVTAVDAEPDTESEEALSQIVVDVAGAVRNPGVYYLNEGSIVDNAITSAGGFTEEADRSYVAQEINRAQLLENHGKVYIPPQDLSTEEPQTDYTASAPSNGVANTNRTININEDSRQDLRELPGIGPVLSERIVEFRRLNGDFENVDELKQVPGIGDGIFSQLQEQIEI